MVEQPFHHQVPIGDRRLEHVERRHLAEIGIGAGAEAQLVGMRRQADIDRQHPQLLQHFEDARLGRDRQRKEHEVDAGAAGEFDDVVDLAEFGAAGAGIQRAAVVAVVEHAEHGNVGVVLGLQRFDELLAVFIGADDHGAAVEPALMRPAADHPAQEQPLGDQRGEADEEESRQPQPRNLAAELGEEGRADEQQEDERPGRDHPRHLAKLAAEHTDLVKVGGLEADHRDHRHRQDRSDIFPMEAGEPHRIAEIDRSPDEAEQHEIGKAHGARDHDRRIGGADLLAGDGKGGLRQPAPPFDRRAAGHHGGGSCRSCRGIEHRASVDRFHCPRPLLHAHLRARAPRRYSPSVGLTVKSEETVTLVNDG